MPDLSKKARVRLTSEQRAEFSRIARSGSVGVRQARRARILLLVDETHEEGRRPDPYVAEVLGVSSRHVARTRQAFVREGEASLPRKTRSDAGTPRKLDGEAEARLVTLCCGSPPEGRERWTLQLLCDELARLEIVESVCVETVRKTLKKTNSSLGDPDASASRTRTAPASSPTWRRSSTSIARATTRRVR